MELADLLDLTRLTLPDDPADRKPSDLLQAGYEIVPFVGREAELADLAAWCDKSAPVAVRLFTGVGGSGKTRLLIEACRQRGPGWRAGFLHSADRLTDPNAARDILLNSGEDRLVVLDYAETRRPFLIDLLKRATGPGRVGGRLRLVLLARSAGDWWDTLIREDARIGDLLQQTGNRRLQPLFATTDERPQHVQTAAEAMARALQRPLPTPLKVGTLDADVLGQPLYLWMAALLALYDEEARETEAALLDGILDHEQRFWRKKLRAQGWVLGFAETREVVGPWVAALTLVGGVENRDALGALLDAVGPVPSEKLKPVEKLLRDLYPRGRHGVSGLEPDIFGEHLVGVVLEEGRQAGRTHE